MNERKSDWIARWIWRLIAVVGLAYACVVACMSLMQRKMVFVPISLTAAEAMPIAKSSGLEPWVGEDGTLLGYKFDQALEAKATALILHGHSGFAAQRGYYVPALRRHGLNIRILEYPGYGTKAGQPSEAAFVNEAARGLSEILKKDPHLPIILVGESIGSGVASQLAASHPKDIAGLLLLLPFDSLVSVVSQSYPWLPVKFILLDRFDSATALQSYPGPVFIVTAEHDLIVPPKFGRALYDGVASPKKLLQLAGYNHWVTYVAANELVWEEALHFLLPLPAPDRSPSASF